MAYEANPGLIALSRFGYGPRADGDVAIAAADPRGFLEAELAQPGITLLSGPRLPTTPVAIRQYFEEAARRKAEREQLAAAAANGAPAPALPPVGGAKSAGPPDPARMMAMAAGGAKPGAIPGAMSAGAMSAGAMSAGAMSAGAMSAGAMSAGADAAATKPPKPPAPGQIVLRDEALARIRRAIEARAGFAERLVAFWSNHFCVSVGKGGIARITAGAFEREAIRPHVLGHFADMLLAVESHPAMLHFLDNQQSVGPNSRAGQRGKRGLNENLGREIMELHTLGVGSGYTQTDVTNLAKILTGWSYVGPKGIRGDPGTFVFNANAHEPGPITLLGHTYAENGVDQGNAALLDIARRPETARFIAGKLARAFVSDTPPPALVDRLARTFQETDGDLGAVSRALIAAPESWERAPAKMRTPYDLIIATNRLIGHVPEDPGQVMGPLVAMGMGLWAPPGPNGFPIDNAAWASPEGMKLRLDYCALVAGKVKDPPNPSDLLEALCGGAPSPETREAVSRAESRQQGLALLLMSPEMQRS